MEIKIVGLGKINIDKRSATDTKSGRRIVVNRVIVDRVIVNRVEIVISGNRRKKRQEHQSGGKDSPQKGNPRPGR